jgi:hypothetical protein
MRPGNELDPPATAVRDAVTRALREDLEPLGDVTARVGLLAVWTGEHQQRLDLSEREAALVHLSQVLPAGEDEEMAEERAQARRGLAELGRYVRCRYAWHTQIVAQMQSFRFRNSCSCDAHHTVT